MVSVIQQSQIEQLQIPAAECIEWVQQGFLMKDETQMPAKLSVHPQGEDFMTSMPCLLPKHNGKKYFGIKLVSRIEGQTPTLKSDITLYDAATGQLLAIIDGDWITAMRTGAVAALAARIGLGNIARAVALCLIEDNKHRHITIRLMRYKSQAEEFMERFKAYDNITFEIVDDKNAFLAGADVLISCVTVATELLFPDDTLFKKGVTVIPVHVRGFQNCDLFFDKVYGDDYDQVKGFKYFDRFKSFAETAQVLNGEKPGRESEKERILVYNVGMSLHDVFAASKIYKYFEQEGKQESIGPKERFWL